MMKLIFSRKTRYGVLDNKLKTIVFPMFQIYLEFSHLYFFNRSPNYLSLWGHWRYSYDDCWEGLIKKWNSFGFIKMKFKKVKIPTALWDFLSRGVFVYKNIELCTNKILRTLHWVEPVGLKPLSKGCNAIVNLDNVDAVDKWIDLHSSSNCQPSRKLLFLLSYPIIACLSRLSRLYPEAPSVFNRNINAIL